MMCPRCRCCSLSKDDACAGGCDDQGRHKCDQCHALIDAGDGYPVPQVSRGGDYGGKIGYVHADCVLPWEAENLREVR